MTSESFVVLPSSAYGNSLRKPFICRISTGAPSAGDATKRPSSLGVSLARPDSNEVRNHPSRRCLAMFECTTNQIAQAATLSITQCLKSVEFRL